MKFLKLLTFFPEKLGSMCELLEIYNNAPSKVSPGGNFAPIKVQHEQIRVYLLIEKCHPRKRNHILVKLTTS